MKQPTISDRIAKRQALEALRSGVPNRQAVRLLGCDQPTAVTRFTDMLIGSPETETRGLLVSGGFGTGKSHLLTHFEHLALSRDFVCSKVAISKETPLYDLGKVFASAMESGRLPDRQGRFIEELAEGMDVDSDAYRGFARWAEGAADNNRLNAMLPASLKVHQESDDDELKSEVESFWAGDKLRVARLRSGLRDIGRLRSYSFRAPKAADLPAQRLAFAVELIKGAGYSGWVVLLDELELVGSYSILQRGRAYAELARWMGEARDRYPGLIVAATVTDDFAAAIISPDGDKKDRDYIEPRLQNTIRYRTHVRDARIGMDILERRALPLDAPSDEQVAQTMGRLRQLYGDAYGWPAPPIADATAGGAGSQARMRHKVRAAINEWDLRRLRPGAQPDTEIRDYAPTYEEDPSLEADLLPDDTE